MILVSKFMGLIYPWHRSGLCSHYLYPTNIEATQLELQALILWSLLGYDVLLFLVLPLLPPRWRNWLRLVRTINLKFLQATTASPWSRPPPDGESDHHLPLLLLFLNGLTAHPLEMEEIWWSRAGIGSADIGETDDKYNNTNDLLQTNYKLSSLVSSCRSRSPLSMVHHSDNDKHDHQVFAKTSDPK